MSTRYRFDHRAPLNRKKHLLIIFGISIVFLAIIGTITSVVIIKSFNNHVVGSVNGPANPAGKVLGDATNSPNQTINEPFFTMSLPDDWRQTTSVNTITDHSTTWITTIDGDSRWLTVYTDTIPSNFAVNQLLPVVSQGDSLTYGNLSSNCVNFTSVNTNPEPVNPVMAKWDGISFWCDVPDRADDKIGTGSVGSINSIALTGPTAGTHHYFFVYTDHDAEPDYDILYTAIDSFREK